MQPFHLTGDALWERMDRAVEQVRQRLERATAALEAAGVPYAIVGGNAVRAWVAQADEAAVRNTRDVDLMIRRDDLLATKAALEASGFVYRHVKSVDLFLDGPKAKPRDAIHLVFAGEKVRPEHPYPAPEVEEVEQVERHRTLRLEPLVRMKLNSFRPKDQMHLLDMIEVGLIDASWSDRLPPELAARLNEVLQQAE
jgi:hypothetical protein